MEESKENGGGRGKGRMGFDEESPLLVSTMELDLDDLDFDTGKADLLSPSSNAAAHDHPSSSSPPPPSEATATVTQTCTNIVKTCMGTGTLALPFAASQGGLLFNLIGLAAFAYWNYYAVDALVKCLHLLPTPVISVNNNNNNGNADEQHRISGSERCTRHRRTRSSMQRLFHSILHKNEDAVKQYNNDEDEEYYQSILQNQPPKGTATYGKVAWYALGPIGFQLVDLALLIFFMGVLIAFEGVCIFVFFFFTLLRCHFA